MANSFNTQQNVAGKIASTALGLLLPDMVLSRTVNRDYEADFAGGVGNVVNVRRPATLTANTRAYGDSTNITVDDVTEPNVQPVTITDNVYSAVSVTDEDVNMELEDFGRQILLPQTTAVAYKLEQIVAAEMSALSATTGLVGDDIPATFANARKALRDLGVAPAGLNVAVGTGVAAELLKSDIFRRADASGSADALTNATLGRLLGFNIIESNMLDPDDAIFYHRDAFTLAVRAPRVPEGVAFGQSVASNGFALRWIRDYDSAKLADRSIVSTFVGTETMSLTKQADGSAVVPAIRIAF